MGHMVKIRWVGVHGKHGKGAVLMQRRPKMGATGMGNSGCVRGGCAKDALKRNSHPCRQTKDGEGGTAKALGYGHRRGHRHGWLGMGCAVACDINRS